MCLKYYGTSSVLREFVPDDDDDDDDDERMNFNVA